MNGILKVLKPRRPTQYPGQQWQRGAQDQDQPAVGDQLREGRFPALGPDVPHEWHRVEADGRGHAQVRDDGHLEGGPQRSQLREGRDAEGELLMREEKVQLILKQELKTDLSTYPRTQRHCLDSDQQLQRVLHHQQYGDTGQQQQQQHRHRVDQISLQRRRTALLV